MTNPELTVIAPCFNEELNIDLLCARTLAAFAGMPIAAELVLVDDGSTDGTWARISEAAERHPCIRGVRHDRNRGMVPAWLSGLADARAPLVCLIDADLQNRPEDIARLHAAYVEKRPDIVQAVRLAKSNPIRIAFSRALSGILNVAFKMRLRDNKSTFLLCRREVLADILSDAPGYRYFQAFLGVAAGARGLRIAEVDTVFEPRHAGESFIPPFPVLISLQTLQEMFRYRVETLRRRKP